MAESPVMRTEEQTRLKQVNWGNRELLQANYIHRNASAYFVAEELDRWSKP